MDTEPGFAPPVGEDVIEGNFLVYTRGWDAPDAVADRVGAYSLDSARRFDAEDPDYDSIWQLRSTADWEAVYTAAIDRRTWCWSSPSAWPERAAGRPTTPSSTAVEPCHHRHARGRPLATGAEVIVAVLDAGVSEGPDGFAPAVRGGLVEER